MADTNFAEPILAFETPRRFEAWIKKQKPGQITGLWIRFYHKASGVKAMDYAEALDVALCYGWIDGVMRKHDDISYIRHFVPRRQRSLWSKINVGHATRLQAAGRMTAAGLVQINAAKADGRWARAYHGAKDAPMPEDFMTRLAKDKKALAFYKTLNASNTYAIRYRLQTAVNPETREKRLLKILSMMKAQRKFH